MRQPHFTAIAALYQAGYCQEIVRTLAVSPTLGRFPFRQWNHVLLLQIDPLVIVKTWHYTFRSETLSRSSSRGNCCTIHKMEIEIAASKVNRYASIESGDTLEVVERPNGGLSVVLADGQTTGKGAKTISSMVVRKIISLLAEGIRDGAAARAASDYLFTERGGKVSACLHILSVDFHSNTIVITRNSPTPVFVIRDEKIEQIDSTSSPIGTSRNIRPTIAEIPLEGGITIILFTDGLLHAGESTGTQMDIRTSLESLLEEEDPSAQVVADQLLSQAVRLDQNRPNDDMSVVVLHVSPREQDSVRRMTIHLPVPGIYMRK
jgi:serine phosphatase RsbU (regulator of sigma subunit)